MAAQKQSSSKPKPRPSRSNSLQRMLELEKQCMLDRRHAHPTPHNATAGSPGSGTASAHLPQQHHRQQSHHLQAQPQHQLPRGRQPSADIAPLLLTRDPNIQSPTPRALNIQKQGHSHSPPQSPPSFQDSHNTDQQQRQRRRTQQQQQQQANSGGGTTDIPAELALQLPGPIADLPAAAGLKSARKSKQEDRRGKGGGGGLSPETVSAARGTPSPPAKIENSLPDLKVVTFLEPAPSVDDRESVCQSPSWEAYGRRKKEKKDRVLADKEAKSKKRRLTKVPPSPTTAAAAAPPNIATTNLPVSTPPSEAASPSVQAQTSGKTRHAQTPSSLSQPRPAADRSASAMASYNTAAVAADLPPLDMPPAPHTPRSRSGSFSSLFKAPFEFRRPSVDHDRERSTGFIGGIKLEQHRNETYQRALDEAILGPGGEIHPAFRRERRSSSPLRIFTRSREPEDRHYPPIAIRTPKNQALLAPEQPQTTDGGMMKKWRERVGLKPSSKASGHDSDTDDRKGRRPRRLSKPASREPSATRAAGHSKSSSMPVLEAPAASRPQLAPSPLKSSEAVTSGRNVSDKAEALPQELDGHEREAPIELPSPLTSDDLSQPSFTTADEVPPPPPRKSSKRKSLISLSDADFGDGLPPPNPLGIDFPVTVIADSSDARRSSTSLSDARTTRPSTDRKAPAPSKLSKAHRQSISNPPSIPYDSLAPAADEWAPPKRTLRDAARAAFGRPASSASQYVIPNVPSSSRPASRSRQPYYPDTDARPSSSAAAAYLARDSPNASKPARVLGEVDWRTGYTSTTTSPPTNSSDDSATDDGHAPDTPDTSRPQSERGGSFDPGDGKRPRPAALNSALPSPVLPAEKPGTVELDNVQAAAMKVMAAFPDAPPKRPDGDWRSSSESNLTVSFLPKVKRESFQSSRDRSKPRPIKTNIPPVKDGESKSPPLRDLLMAKDESAATAPWPATYLEAARKAAPAAPPPKALNVQASSSAPNLAPPKRIGNNRSRQSSPGPSHLRNGTVVPDGEPIAKMFVECCACKFYHDMPSKLYEAMAHPEDVVPVAADHVEFAGALSMTVKCPWCKHEMSTKCCAGLAAMVYVKERLH